MRMSCISKEHKKGKSSDQLENNSCSSMGHQQESISSSKVSASELSYLQAQVWIFENRLREEKRSVENLTESFKEAANEKYELLQELTCQKQLCQQLYENLQQESENGAVLMKEIECLQKEADKNPSILEKVVTQNVELKESIMHAKETIHQMGLMYLKLKQFHNL